MADLTHEDVQRILKVIDEMGDRDVHLEIGELKLHVTRGAASVEDAASRAVAAPASVSASASTSKQTPVEVPAGHIAIRAPTMGIFYRASSPGAKPHTEIDAHVAADDTVGVFEVMKLFSTLKAGIAGTVTAIPAANESMVEQDQVLVIIKPDR